MLAAAAMHELSGEARWLELWRESAAWLRDQWDPDTGLWTQHLYGRVQQIIGPGPRLRRLHARPCPGRGRGAPSSCGVDDGPLRGRGGRARQLAAGHRRGPGARANRVDPGAVVPRRARRGRIACLLRARRRRARTVAARGRRAHLARRPAGEGSEPVPRHRGQRLRLPGAARAHRGRAVARARPRVRDARCSPGRAATRRVRARPLRALVWRPRHSALPRGLPRRSRRPPLP